ncbi:MAG: phosphatidylserine decarboxylase [Ruminococcaceae bacterium]|nr:phosphatidylserine decarboxylase [Oscillospiraceae bacterium]
MIETENKYEAIDICEKDTLSVRFLYNTSVGRAFLKLLIKPSLSKFVGKYMNSKLSCVWIKGFIKRNSIDMSQYEDRKYGSFNDFFIRKILPDKRSVELNPNALIAPCDSKLSVYKINSDSVFSIKHSSYTINDLLQNEEISKEYENGYCFIYRLTTDDYHRYSHIDDGKIIYIKYINGVLHTVRPIAQNRYPIFAQNSREYTIIETENFGKIVQIEIGALLIGKISNNKEQTVVKRGEEKGMFEFGGSTIVVLFKDGTIAPDSQILANTENDKETVVKLGMKIGEKL